MGRDAAPSTGTTLLGLLGAPDSPRAWSTFVDRYGPTIYAWCRRRWLQDADARDVTQEVLLKLHKHLRTFAYDPGKGSFRGFLKTVTRRALADFWEDRRQRPAAGTGKSEVLEILNQVEARDDLAGSLEKDFDLELWEEAKVRVRPRVNPRDWKIFAALALEGRKAEGVAAELGMKYAAVCMAKSRVLKKLKEEVRFLDGQGVGRGEGES
jgi:RNA polymerase sigma factor (sigma-70 family)